MILQSTMLKLILRKGFFMNKFNTIRTSIPGFFKALVDKNTPASAKIAVGLAILYAIMPADFVTDALPFLGWFDDAIVMTILFTIANKMIPDTVKEKEANKKTYDVDYEVIEDKNNPSFS